MRIIRVKRSNTILRRWKSAKTIAAKTIAAKTIAAKTIAANIRFSNAFYTWIFLLLCLSNAQNLIAQGTDDVQSNQPLFLQAEKLIGNATPNGFVRELIGNVVLTQGSVNITCNRAVHYVEQNRADLFGNVILKQGGVTMKAAQATYNGFSRQISGSGGVTLVDSNSTLTAREGWYSTVSKIARFFRAVSIENDSLLITCDTLEHHRISQNSYATGNASAASRRSTALLQGDSLVHIPADKYTRLMRRQGGKVPPMVSQIDTVETGKQERTSQNTSNKKSSVKTSQKKQSSTIASIEVPEKRLDTLCITGNVLEAFRSDSSEVYHATGDVQLNRRQLAGRSDLGIYEKTQNRIRLLPLVGLNNTTTSATRLESTATVQTSTQALTPQAIPQQAITKSIMTELNTKATIQNTKATIQTISEASPSERPRLWLDSTQLRADSILIVLEGKRLERINALGNAFSATKNDSAQADRIDQLQGENIIISLRRDTLRSILAEGKAFSLYFASSENDNGESEPDGAVKNAADTVKILFTDGNIETIVWRGKVEGEYIPEHIARKQLQTLRLKGFAWMNDRPRLERRGKTSSKAKQATSSSSEKIKPEKVKPEKAQSEKIKPEKIKPEKAKSEEKPNQAKSAPSQTTD